ncbi:carbohydrate ABC transporter permease [Paracoccus caeni]|uniref:Carbohydrate ABC transporter permease n=1 Tax=Paracoccus caeni TaxID=657651 RepID=A0A934SDY7_9RHOB|nr:carbohydrate ABC transporter permease [Paracoccus caeni]MBK4215604.1 carbohydrate ABC transporter permease [Paracoccus caeni]
MADAANPVTRTNVSRPTTGALKWVMRAPGLFCLGLFLILWMAPILLVLITSVKSNADFLAGPFSLPSALTFAPYKTVWEALGFSTLMINSVIYATLGSALAVILALVPAYALARKNIPGQKIIFALLLTGLMIPQQTVLIPLYDTLRQLSLLDTKLGLIIVHAAYGMPSQVLILRGFMTGIPKELDKAAYLEGASDFQIFSKVILPLALPGIIVGYTLNFIAIWKEFIFGLVFLNSESNFPLTVGMLKLNSDRYMSVFNMPAAGLVISQIPIVIVFILTYRKLSSGQFAGAVKG